MTHLIQTMTNKKQQRNQKSTTPDLPKHFTSHIAELQKRLIIAVISMVAGGVVSYTYRDQILGFLLKPLATQQLYYASPLGAMSFTFEICLIAGMLLSSPIWLYQLWSFFKPVIPHTWQEKFTLWVAISTALAFIGAGYGYFISLPAALAVSKYFQSQQLIPLLSAPEYLSFVSKYIFAFALFFQLPLIIFFTAIAGFVNSTTLIQHQRHSFLASVVVGAVFTPTPDFINQLALALPLFVLYELSLLAVILSERALKKKPHPTP